MPPRALCSRQWNAGRVCAHLLSPSRVMPGCAASVARGILTAAARTASSRAAAGGGGPHSVTASQPLMAQHAAPCTSETRQVDVPCVSSSGRWGSRRQQALGSHPACSPAWRRQTPAGPRRRAAPCRLSHTMTAAYRHHACMHRVRTHGNRHTHQSLCAGTIQTLHCALRTACTRETTCQQHVPCSRGTDACLLPWW